MEDALRVVNTAAQKIEDNRLNPCSNGRCSQRMQSDTVKTNSEVLILVLMEYALRDSISNMNIAEILKS